jgi:M3 family oligoendopeptidase
MKVSQIPYTRPNKEEVLAALDAFKARFDGAANVSEFLAVHADYKAYSAELSTTIQMAFIRFSQDTRNESYVAEQDYMDEILPELGLKSAEVSKCYVESKFRAELEKVFPAVLFVNLQMQIDASSDKIVDLKVEQNKITSDYTKLVSSLTIEFNGEKLPISGISKYFTNPDRELRKGAIIAWGQVFEDNKAALDEIFDKLVKIRTEMGKRMGYPNFSPLGYLNMQRNCYTKDDIAKFRANVKKYLVPLATKIRAKVQSEQGWEKQYLYDSYVFTKNEPKPIGTPEEIFAAGSKMYHELSDETGKMFDLMVESEAFDALSREGKWGGGYCTELPKYKIPFILSNFNGSAGDVEVLTHEFGHAFAAYKSFDIDTEFLASYGMETAEVHSMSMEFLTYPWMPLFFGDNTEEFFFHHIAGSLTFIPYGTIVDYFQQVIYDNPDMTPAERVKFYGEIEKEFLPWFTTEGIPAFQDGRRWQRQSHIFESPFYYIDYCLAQFTALQFLALSRQDFKSAFDKYVRFVSMGGTKNFVELLKSADLLSPFEEDSFKLIVKSVEEILKV